ncbi:type II secretion system protein GspG [Pseudobdellovibrio sp. HCB154]|uniref:type II secretion system protein GspG n=1 Tax=Pseudobdellovibrio sp. HCB154 TaxID=3386277 RepID=UPI00391708D9
MLKLFKSQRSSTISNNKGFSLGEIMIVLVIIGGIMAIVLPKIQDGQRRGEVNQTKMKMTEVTTKINEYYAECGKYPTALSFITDDDSSCKNWTGNPRQSNILKDAWGSEFQYSTSGNGYNLFSLGRDKKAGGSSFDKDIYSDESVGSEE